MNWIGILFGAILGRFYLIFEKISRALKERERQEKADRAASDPAGEIADHFGGQVHQMKDKEDIG